MGADSKIEWTDATWNQLRGCSRVSEGCRHCYAERWNGARGTGLLYKPGVFDSGAIDVYLDEAVLDRPFRWRRPRTIFVCSMTDPFGRFVGDEAILRIFAVMLGAKHHRFIVLTKRPERMRELLARMKPDGQGWMTRDGRPAMSGGHPLIVSPDHWPPPNVWLGTSIENRAALERLEHLRATPAAKRLISAEPLLEDLGPVNLAGIDWLIAGGESGPGARPMHPDWARSLRDQCRNAGVPFFFKQWGEWTPGENVDRTRGIVESAHWFNDKWSFGRENLANEDGHVDDEPDLYRVGKKAAGRLLDGRTWDELPAREERAT